MRGCASIGDFDNTKMKGSKMAKEEKKNWSNSNVSSLLKKTAYCGGGFATAMLVTKQVVKEVSKEGLYGTAPYLDALAKIGGGSSGRGTLLVVAVVAAATVAGYAIAEHAEKRAAAGKEG